METHGLLEPAGIDENGRPLGCGRIGYLTEAMPLYEFLRLLQDRLPVNGLRYIAAESRCKVAVCGGSGGNMLDLRRGRVRHVCYADIKYDRFLAARSSGGSDRADHFCTENIVMPVLAQTPTTLSRP